MRNGGGRTGRRRLRPPVAPANMLPEQDGQDHDVTEIRAGREAGGEAGRPEDGTGAEAGPRRAQGPRKARAPRTPSSEGAKAPRPERVATPEVRAARPGIQGEDRAPKPARKAVTRGRSVTAPPMALAVPGMARLGQVAGLRRIGLCAALGAFWVLGGCGGGVSGEIGQACITSGREAASRQLCSCVQGVANQTLSPADQRRVARFFGNPDEAEAVRSSDSARDEAFWDRFSNFTDTAEAICG